MSPSYSCCILVLLVLLLERVSICHAQISARPSASPPVFTKEQKQRAVDALESSLLRMFGFSKRPRPSRNVVIPQYMIDLYRQQTGDLDTDIPSVFVRRQGTQQANTVRSFFHEDVLHDTGCSEHNCARLWFNVTYIPDSETLADAELRVFLERNITHEPDNIHKVLKHKLQVFEIMKPVTKDAEPISRLIDVHDIIVQNSTWTSLDVRPAVLKWKSKPRTNHGLEIRLVPHKNNPTSSPLKHVRLRRSAETTEDVWNVQRPLLVTYTDDGKSSFSRPKRSTETTNSSDKSDKSETSKSDKGKSRKKGRRCPKGPEGRSCRKRRKERKRRQEQKRKNREEKRRRKNEKKKDKNKDKNKNPDATERPGHKNLCQRKPLYVEFAEVGWEDWIVAPLGYPAFYCDGNCPFPLSDNLNATNHAIVQTLVNSVDAKAAPTACCVPTTLSSISMLYLDEYDKTILKQYDDMVVEGCGCR